MTEKAATVSAGCARAIAAGRKTMLRQVAAAASAPCPLGAAGDRAWLSSRESAPTLVEIESTHLERLHDITDDDLEAEGGLWASITRRPSHRATHSRTGGTPSTRAPERVGMTTRSFGW